MWSGCPLNTSLRRCFGHVYLKGVPGAKPGQAGEIISLGWCGHTLEEEVEVAVAVASLSIAKCDNY